MIPNRLSQISSEAYLCDIHPFGEEGENGGFSRINVSLQGRVPALLAARKFILSAEQEAGCTVEAEIVELRRNKQRSGDRGAYLAVSFKGVPDSLIPVNILNLVHTSTHCDIGASITHGIETYDTTAKKSKETNTHFMPTTNITIRHEDPYTCELVQRYLKQKLQQIFGGKFLYGDVGKIGMPLEFNPGENIRTNEQHHDKIYLTYRDQQTTDGGKAKLIATGTAEHLSGLLNIPERAPGRMNRSVAH